MSGSRKVGLLIKLLAGAFALWLLYFLIVDFLIEGHAEEAQFGDMFGGANALFSALAFAGLIYTILLQREDLVLQRRELAETRKELRGQRQEAEIRNRMLEVEAFENTFFQLLSLHNDIVNNIDVRELDGSGTLEGRDCFRVFYDKLKQSYKKKEAEYKYSLRHEGTLEEWEEGLRDERGRVDRNVRQQAFERLDLDEVSMSESQTRRTIEAAYNQLYSAYEADLGHYFRNLYYVVKFVDRELKDSSEKTGFYIGLVRAQLSSAEHLMLFYNGLSKYGRPKFKPFMEKFSLLHGMPKKSLLGDSHPKFYERTAYETEGNEHLGKRAMG